MTPRPTSSKTLTAPDLVVLSLLAERPMHGYELNAELERRDVRDWAGISRPQVYYSLRKLEGAGLLRSARTGSDARGPRRRVLATSRTGRSALRAALAEPRWAEQRTIPPFLTWMALSWLARAADRRELVARRREYLEAERDRERTTLRALQAEPGDLVAARLMVGLTVDKFELELRWLDEVERELLDS